MTHHDLALAPGHTPGPAPSHPGTAELYGRFWDREDKQVLGPIETTPAFARYWTGLVLHQWGIPAEDPLTVVAELIANAVQATRGASLATPVIARLLAGTGRLVIEIWDQAPGKPVMQDIATAVENGRGLFLVAAFCEQWGWYFHNEWKVVYGDMRF